MLTPKEVGPWTCATCSAQFPAHPLDFGVTRCTKCVEVDVLTSRLDAVTYARDLLLSNRRWIGIEPAEGPIVSMSEAQFAEYAASRRFVQDFMATTGDTDKAYWAREARRLFPQPPGEAAR